MKPVRLLVELGGTHTRCAIQTGPGRPQGMRVFRNEDFDALAPVLASYLGDTSVPRPDLAAIAIAAPVSGDRVELTNLGWTIDARALAQAFALNAVYLINDFTALALALPFLDASERMQIGGGAPQPRTAIAVIGPGTGLGVSGLVPAGDSWVPLQSEGGHVTLAAADPADAEIIARLGKDLDHVSAERVLSGPGLIALHRAIHGEAAVPAGSRPESVNALAAEGNAAALATLDMFFAMLGTVAGNLALTLGARGGVFLGGGILPRMREQLLSSRFRQRFESKGRFRRYLSDIPVYLITADTPALIGLNAHVDELLG